MMMNFVPWKPQIPPLDNPRPPISAVDPSWIDRKKGGKRNDSPRRKLRRYGGGYPTKKKPWRSTAPLAPRNTTSFLMRASKSGGIASLVSPCPVTPAVLPTPRFSPSREGVVDMAKEEWGVDGYGSMKGLIRLRVGVGEARAEEEEEVEEMVEEDGESSESDVEEHVEVERRLDHDLSRFEMVCHPGDGAAAGRVLSNRVDDQHTHIVQLEEENLTLKERVFVMERQMGELRRRVMVLEMVYQAREEEHRVNATEEVLDNGDVCSEKSVVDRGLIVAAMG